MPSDAQLIDLVWYLWAVLIGMRVTDMVLDYLKID
jgi:hypothetical protein